MADFLPFDTERCTIRQLTVADAPAVAEYRSDPDVAKYETWTAPYTLEQAVKLIEKNDAAEPLPNQGFSCAVGDRATGELIGEIYIERHRQFATAEIGYSFARPRHGVGLATETVGAAIDRLFEFYDLHRIEAMLHPDNIPSGRLLERLGFVYEGTSRESFQEPDGWSDDARYGLLRTDRQVWLDRPRHTPATVTLVDIDGSNVRDYLRLATHRTQERFVAPMAMSLAQAGAPPVDNGITAVPWKRGIVADDATVGFVMVSDVAADEPVPFIWRFLMDRMHQRRGIGERALRQVIDHFRSLGHPSIKISYIIAAGGPEGLYHKIGFEPTGEMDGDETVAELRL